MIVYLIGFMGSGKSTLGRRMASRAGWRFKDLDYLIEDADGRSVQDIFQQSGEEYFRKIEARTLRSLKTADNIVLACGGGTPCDKDNMAFMNREGVTVYLKHDPATLYHRLSKAKKLRPLLAGMHPDEMKDYIRITLDERENWYNKAQFIIDGLKADPGKIMDIILSYPPYNP
ncbi:MAG TPA: shikimate kinase [Bacteroidales bacterium]|nr:shikimate kinase [Bacteroidales bacterium]